MRTVFALLALLLCSEARAQSFPGFLPPQTVVCNNTTSEAQAINCKFINLALVPNQWFTNDSPPMVINKLGDRVFIGDAVKYGATSPITGTTFGDWWSQYSCAIPGFCNVYSGNASLLVESSATNRFGTNAIVGMASTTPCFGFNCGAIPVIGVGLNNVAASAGKTYNVWGMYAECNNRTSNTGQCTGLEIDLGQEWNYGHPSAYDPFDESKNTGLMIFCGLSNTPNDCGSALYIEGIGTNGWVSGFVFQDGSVMSGRGPTVNGAASTVAFGMPRTYATVWYSAANTASAAIYSGTANKLTLWARDNINLQANDGTGTIDINPGGSGGININTVPGVSCSGPPSGSFAVTNGIVTHC